MIRCLLFLLLILFFHPAKAQQAELQKIAGVLKEKMKGAGPGDTLLINFSYTGDKPPITSYLLKKEHYTAGNIITGWLRNEDINRLAAHPSVLFIAPVELPREELSTGSYDLSLNRINYAHARFPAIRGSSIQATLKERSFDTTDIDLQGRVLPTSIAHPVVTVHASLMATILAGAGNSSPSALGAAPSAKLGPVSFDNLLPEPESFYRTFHISVQNHSYGTVLQPFYGNDAAAYDASAQQLPNLLHVYSSGNSGNALAASGPYAGIPGYSNLTGNVKEAKNILVVGASDSLGVLQSASSSGPTHDGRVKPELIAFGEDGTSGAAALVSGAAILVQEYFLQLHHDSLPSSSMVKAILVNSADDVHEPNVDHRSGYGQLNAYKALKTVQQSWLHSGQVIQGGTDLLIVPVGINLAQLKVTLTWNDPAGPPGAQRSLVNDLDLRIRQVGSGREWLPWSLSHAPHLDSLRLPAVRKVDTVNNVEQVTVDLASAGDYVIEVKGSRVTGNAQPFSIAYAFDTAGTFQFTYPVESIPLTGGHTHALRWDTNIPGSGLLEYSFDGFVWLAAGPVPDLSAGYFKWTVPDTLATALLRMRTSVGGPFVSDRFVISPGIQLRAGYDCLDSFMLFWNRIPNAVYELEQLSQNRLQHMAFTTDTSIVLSAAQFPSAYYSVRPVLGARAGQRSATLNYRAAAYGCYLEAFYLQLQTLQAAHFTARLGTTADIAKAVLQKRSGAQFLDRDEVAPLHTLLQFTDSGLVRGANYYRLKLVLANGRTLYSDVQVVYHLPQGQPVIVYPNPLPQNNSLQIITSESGRYRVQILDGQGRLLQERLLNTTITTIEGTLFTGGLYYLRFQDREGAMWTEKLVVF